VRMLNGVDSMRFIYVFSESDKQLLVDMGYTLLKEDGSNSLYVFKNDNSLSFCMDATKFAYSDVLTF